MGLTRVVFNAEIAFEEEVVTPITVQRIKADIEAGLANDTGDPPLPAPYSVMVSQANNAAKKA